MSDLERVPMGLSQECRPVTSPHLGEVGSRLRDPGEGEPARQ